MNNHVRLLWTACLLGVLLCVPPVPADEGAEEKAVSASNAWLGLVDQAKYSESWDKAAAYFRRAVTKEQWEQALQGVRKPLGRVIRRQVKSTQYATRLPGAPDGEYLIIQYDTSFEHKRSSVETVTPMRDPDGRWRVSGYFIR
jgi:Protein of unknown function (DUF4019)